MTGISTKDKKRYIPLVFAKRGNDNMCHMKRKEIGVGILAAVASVAFAAEMPQSVFQRNFDTDAADPYVSGGEMRIGQGVDCSTACWVGTNVYVQKCSFPLDLVEFTVDFKFRLDGPVDAKVGNTLLCYVTRSWGKGSFRIRISPDSRLEAIFEGGAPIPPRASGWSSFPDASTPSVSRSMPRDA